jgi:hypothetical protein
MSSETISYRRSPRLRRQHGDETNGILAQSHVFFGDEYLFYAMLQYLSPESCLRLGETTVLMSKLCGGDPIWKYYCHQLWMTKVHCPYAHVAYGFKSAYYRSITYSKYAIVGSDEISHWMFNFRFKNDAGEHWLSNCPWHLNREATIIRLKKNMIVSRYVRKDDSRLLQNNFEDHGDFMTIQPPPLSSVDRKPLEEIYTKCSNDLVPRYNHGHDVIEDDLVPDPFFPYIKTWELIWKLRPMMQLKNLQRKLFTLCRIGNVLNTCQPFETFSTFELHILDINYGSHLPCSKPSCSKDGLLYCLHSGKYGNTIKINIQGVPVPSYLISRSPLNNWGFVFQSCWAVCKFQLPPFNRLVITFLILLIYLDTSWHMPLKGKCPELEDKHLKVRQT